MDGSYLPRDEGDLEEATSDEDSEAEAFQIVEIPTTTARKFTLRIVRKSKVLFNLDIHLKKPEQRSLGVNVGRDSLLQSPQASGPESNEKLSKGQQTENETKSGNSQQAQKSYHQQTDAERSKSQLENGVEIQRDIVSYSENVSDKHQETWTNIREKIKIQKKQPTLDSRIRSESLSKSKFRYVKHIKDNDEKISIVASTHGNPVIDEIIAFPGAESGSPANLAFLLSNFEDSVIFRSETEDDVATSRSNFQADQSTFNITADENSTKNASSGKLELNTENRSSQSQMSVSNRSVLESTHNEPSNLSSIMDYDDVNPLVHDSTLSTLKNTLSENTLMDSSFSNLLAQKSPTFVVSDVLSLPSKAATNIQKSNALTSEKKLVARETIDVEFSDLLKIEDHPHENQ